MNLKQLNAIRIMLVDDHELTRRQMAGLIKTQSDMELVGEAITGEESLAKANQSKADVIVMDILLPGMNGVEACRSIAKSLPNARILVLSNHSGKTLVQAALDAGALGYVRKDCAFEELIPAIRSTAANQRFLGAKIAER